jgi:hypothetical protein
LIPAESGFLAGMRKIEDAGTGPQTVDLNPASGHLPTRSMPCVPCRFALRLSRLRGSRPPERPSASGYRCHINGTIRPERYRDWLGTPSLCSIFAATLLAATPPAKLPRLPRKHEGGLGTVQSGRPRGYVFRPLGPQRQEMRHAPWHDDAVPAHARRAAPWVPPGAPPTSAARRMAVDAAESGLAPKTRASLEINDNIES